MISGYNFTDNLQGRLDAMLEALNPDDIPFLVAAVRFWAAQHLRLSVKERREKELLEEINA